MRHNSDRRFSIDAAASRLAKLSALVNPLVLETVMSSSTTATTSYVLTKYSRSYPKNTSGTSQADPEWQHFSNPVIRLLVDVKKSSNGTLESYRLRIIWSMFSEPDSMDTDQQEMIFVKYLHTIYDRAC